MNRLDDAIGDYGAVLNLDPRSATALNNRANAYRRENRLEEARRDYLTSLAADGSALEYPYYGLGQIAESEGKPQDAKDFYARAVAANPGYSLAADRLAALGGIPAPAPVMAAQPPKTASAEKSPLAPDVKVALAPPPTIRSAGDPARVGQSDPRPGPDNFRGRQVQLGAWRSEAEAAIGWNQTVKKAGGVLAGFSHHIVAVDLPGKGRYYRLTVETPEGKQLCAVLTAKGLSCIPARN
jgi:tetratricopeptide (TPR) repeat protein